MTDAITFEVDLAGVDGLTDPAAIRQRIVDRFRAAIVGDLPGRLGYIIGAEWRGDALRFEYRPSEGVAPTCGCGEPGEVCLRCAHEDEEDARDEAYASGSRESILAMREDIVGILDELADDADVETKAAALDTIRERLDAMPEERL